LGGIVSGLRTFASALCIVLGALLIATWAASFAALNAIENSTVIEDATAKAITTDVAQRALVDKGTQVVLEALAETGFNTDIPGIEGITQGIVEKIVNSDGFVRTVHAQTGSIREQVVAELNSESTGAITVTVDFSAQVNALLKEIPVIGQSLPTIAVPGVPVEIMDASTADTARTTWDWLQLAKKWFGWLGLALLAVGILVSSRKRWFFAKVLLAVGVLSGIIWGAMTLLEPQTVADRLPGGGVADAVIVELVHHVKSNVATTMGYVALGAMIGALVLFTLAARQREGTK
jgi:hypothetical protein